MDSLWLHTQCSIVLSKHGTSDTCHNRNYSSRCYRKWDELFTKCQTLNDSTYVLFIKMERQWCLPWDRALGERGDSIWWPQSFNWRRWNSSTDGHAGCASVWTCVCVCPFVFVGSQPWVSTCEGQCVVLFYSCPTPCSPEAASLTEWRACCCPSRLAGRSSRDPSVSASQLWSYRHMWPQLAVAGFFGAPALKSWHLLWPVKKPLSAQL